MVGRFDSIIWLVVAVAAAVSSALAVRRMVWMRRRAPGDVALLVLLVMLLVSVLVSPLPGTSLDAAPPLLVGVILCLVLARIETTDRRLRSIWWTMILGSALLCLIGFLGMPTTRQEVLRVIPRLTSLLRRMPDTFNENVVAGALVLALPFCLAGTMCGWGAGRWRRTVQRVVPASIAAAMIALLLATGSRGAYLAATASLLALAILLWPRVARWAAPALLLLVVAGGTALGWRSIGDRLISSEGISGLDARIEIWSRALSMIGDFPLTGVGLACFQPVMAALYPLFLVPRGSVSHAHNLFLQVAADLGLPGLVAFLAIVGLAFFGALSAYFASARRGQREMNLLASACLASLTGMCVHGMLDSAVWDNKGAFLPWLVIGLCSTLYRASQQSAAAGT